MKSLGFIDLIKKNLKNDTMNEKKLQGVYKYPLNPRDSPLYSDRRFVNLDDGSQGGNHWTCFIVKDNKSYYFDSFGGQPDDFLLKQVPQAITYHIYKIQYKNSKLCCSYCLHFSI